MDIQVKKGLEKQLVIFGMPQKFFYAYIIITVFLVFILLFMIMLVSRKDSDITFSSLILTFVLEVIVLLFLKVTFSQKAKKKKKIDQVIDIYMNNK